MLILELGHDDGDERQASADNPKVGSIVKWGRSLFALPLTFQIWVAALLQ
jgi:hypothetical protein